VLFEIEFVVTETDECASEPCVNDGTCIDKINGFECVCQPGYSGIQCANGKRRAHYHVLLFTDYSSNLNIKNGSVLCIYVSSIDALWKIQVSFRIQKVTKFCTIMFDIRQRVERLKRRATCTTHVSQNKWCRPTGKSKNVIVSSRVSGNRGHSLFISPWPIMAKIPKSVCNTLTILDVTTKPKLTT